MASRRLLPPPHLFLHTLLLFALPSHQTPTSPPPPISNLTLSLPLPSAPLLAGRDIECFNLTTPKAYPVVLTDCPPAIDLLLHDPTGVMTLQHFSHNHLHISTFRVPFAWQFGACEVLLTSGADLAEDDFRLADVIVKAERIMAECPPKSKRSLGGLALVGHGRTFFVAVNGPDLAPDGEGGGWGGGGGGGDEEAGVFVGGQDLRGEGLVAL